MEQTTNERQKTDLDQVNKALSQSRRAWLTRYLAIAVREHLVEFNQSGQGGVNEAIKYATQKVSEEVQQAMSEEIRQALTEINEMARGRQDEQENNSR